MRIVKYPMNIIVVAIAAFIVLASCAQDIKITAPRYALVYGVAIYNSADLREGVYPNLTYPDDDAKSISDLMMAQGWNVTTKMTGSMVTPRIGTTPPSKQNIFADIDSLSTSIEADSTVFLYFSGHGTAANGTFYIAPYGGIGSSGPDYSKCINPMELATELAKLPTKNIIVIFDTCNSGGFIDTGTAIDASPQNFSTMQAYSVFSTAVSNFGNLLSSNASANGRQAPIVISAAGSLEFSYDGTNGTGNISGTPDGITTIKMDHGVFTYYLLEAATNADSDGDGVVTMSEAYAYTSKSIKAWYIGLPNSVIYNYGFYAFLPHISGGARDLVLFVQ